MARTLFWLSEEEWTRIEPWLPHGRRGAHRVDDRRVISGIVHMLKTGARWRDCPAEYGLYTTIYNQFNQWSKQGVWEDVLYALSGSSGVISTTAVDSTHVKAHRSAAGAKGGHTGPHAWDTWTAWASAHGVSALPAQPEAVAAYLASRATTAGMATLRAALEWRDIEREADCCQLAPKSSHFL